MPPRDSRTASDVAAEKRRRKIKVKRPPAKKLGSLRDIPAPKGARGFGDVLDRATPDPIGGLLRAGKSEAADYLRRQIAAGQDSNRRSKTGAGRIAQDPRVKGITKGVQVVSDIAIGPETRKALTGAQANPLFAGIEVASLFPGLRPLRGTRATGAGAKQIVKGAGREAAGEAMEKTFEGPSLVGRALRGSETPKRKFKVGDSVAEIAAARSRTGRALERGFDKARPITSKIGVGKVRLVKDETQKWAQATQQRIKFDQKSDMVPGLRLRKIGKRLNRPQQYALRSISIGIDPVEAAEYHLRRAVEAEDPLVRAAHQIHADGYKRAAQFVERQGDELELSADAPRNLRKAFELMPEVADVRETMLRDLGLLDEEQMAKRVQDPGRIFKGAKYTPEEEIAHIEVRASESRQQIYSAMEEHGIAPGAISAQLKIMDEQNLAHRQERLDNLKATKKKMERKISDLLEKEAEEGDLSTYDETLLRTLQDGLPEIESQLEEGIPYDELYQRLGHVSATHPDALKAFYTAFHGSGSNIQYKEASAAVVPPRRAVDPKVAAADQAFAKQLAADLATQIGRKTKIDQAGLEAGIVRALEFARLGEDGKFWYEESSQRILALTGGNTVEAEKIAQLIGLLSASTEVGDNVGRAMKAYKQWKAGEPIAIRKDMDAKIVDILEGKPWEGRKTNTFYRNMLEDIDPEKHAELVREAGEGMDDVTVDRHIYATFGLPAGSSAYYDIVQDAYRAIQGHLGWEKPKQVQAASWVIEKFHNVKNRYPKWEDERAWTAATTNYSDALDTPVYTTRFPVEARPGSDAVIPEYASWAPEVQAAYLDAKVPAINDYFAELGLPFTARVEQGAGFWMSDGVLQVNPAIAIDVHSGGFLSDAEMGKLAQAGKDVELPPAEKEMWDATAAGLAVALNQNAASWFRPLRPGRKSQETLLRVDLGRKATEEDMALLSERLGDDAWFSHADNGVWIARADWSQLGIKEYQSLVDEVADSLNPGDHVWFAHVSGYLEGDDLAKQISDRGRLEGVAGSVDRLRAASDAVDAGFRADPVGNARRGLDGLGGQGAAGAVDASRKPAIQRGEGLDAIRPEVAEQVRTGPAGSGFLHGAHARPGNVVAQMLTGGTEKSAVSVSENTLAPLETWVHELAHFWQTHFPGAEKLLKKHYGDDNEAWVEAYLEYVLDLYPQRKIPKVVRDSMDTLSAAILREAQQTGGSFVRSGMPREVAELFDSTLWHRELKGGRIYGEEGFEGGKFYTPFERGFPTSVRHPLAATRAYMRSMVGLFGGGKGRAVGKGFVDPSTVKSFRGYLIENGWYKGDVTAATYDSLAKAVKMDVVQKARRKLLEIGQETPSRADDVPIKINPSKDTDPELKRWWEAVEQMPDDMSVKHLDIEGLKDTDATLFADITRGLSPDQIEGMAVDRVAADIMAGVREPVDNIVWVPAKAIYEGDLFSNPKAFFSRGESWGQLEVMGQGFDVVNDFMKATLLQLNPAYIGMNLLGNAALILMQQGPFALMNIPRAAFLSRELSADLAATIDHYMGRGISHIAETRTLATHPSRVLADVTGQLVDKVPRRAAFLHESWANGYRSADEIAELLVNPALRDDLYEVAQRANDAIIDYERLSPLERKIMTRFFFIYPWIKGATRYTFRFPLEHPAQAMAMAVLYERQQALADEQLGERPWYSEFLLPVGEVERFGETYPQAINPKQLIPFTTPIEFAQALAGAITGNPDTQAFIEILQPFYPALATSLTGYDSFEEREVGKGIRTLGEEMIDIPIVDRFEQLSKTDEERAGAASNRLYPRNERDELLKTFLGTLAPTPYNPEKGEHLAARKKGPTQEQKNREKMDQIREVVPAAALPELEKALSTKVKFEELKEDARKRLGTDDLSEEQLAELMVDLAVFYNPRYASKRDLVVSKINVATASEIRSEMEGILGWNLVDAATRIANEKASQDELKADGKVVSSG